MRPKRPAPVLVIAILHFVFGGLGLVCGLAGLAMQGLMSNMNPMMGKGAAGPGPGRPVAFDPMKIQRLISEKLPTYETVEMTHTGIGIGLSLLLIIAGIGLLQMRSWGWGLSILYAFASLAANIFHFVYTLLFVMPVMREATALMIDEARRAAQNPQERQMLEMVESVSRMTSIMGLAVPILALLYPIAVLIVMFLPSVRRAFRGDTVVPAYQDEPPYQHDER